MKFALVEVVEEAVDGAEGWEKIQKGNFDIILSDIKMPKMDGTELLDSPYFYSEILDDLASVYGKIKMPYDLISTRRRRYSDYLKKRRPEMNKNNCERIFIEEFIDSYVLI